MQVSLRLVESWCKTEELNVSSKEELSKHQRPTIFYSKVLVSTEVTYLGVTWDAELRYKSHLQQAIDKATKAFWACIECMPDKTLGHYMKVILPTATC